MRGGFVHDHVILNTLEAEFRALGVNVSVSRQVPSRSGRTTGYIDLVVRLGAHVLAIEAEMSPARVANDLRKADEIGATSLWIVTANHNVARGGRRQLERLGVQEEDPKILCVTLGEARERVRQFFSLLFPAEGRKGKETANPGPDQKRS